MLVGRGWGGWVGDVRWEGGEGVGEGGLRHDYGFDVVSFKEVFVGFAF